jgi:hypothetical protein
MSRTRTGAVLAAFLCLVLAAPAGAHRKSSTLKFTGGKTTLALAPGAADALSSLGVSVAPLAPARAGRAGIAFPITSGRADAKTLAGAIRHSGGLRLSKGDTVVDLRRFTIRLDKSPDLTAKVGGSRVSILDLDLSGAKVHAGTRRVTVSGVRATLTQAAADALNAAFGTSAFSQGLELGTAKVAGRLAGRH